MDKNGVEIGTMNDEFKEAFERFSERLKEEIRKIIDEDECKDHQLMLNALGYVDTWYLSIFLASAYPDTSVPIKEHVAVFQKNLKFLVDKYKKNPVF